MLGLIQDLEPHEDVGPDAHRRHGQGRGRRGCGRDATGARDDNATSALRDRSMKVQISPMYGAPNGACCVSPVRPPRRGCGVDAGATAAQSVGLAAQSALHGEVSRFAINTLDTTGVALIFITYAELEGNPQHMRYFVHSDSTENPSVSDFRRILGPRRRLARGSGPRRK